MNRPLGLGESHLGQSLSCLPAIMLKEAVLQGLRHGPARALASAAGRAVRQGQAGELAAATQRLVQLHLTPVVLRAAVELSRREPSALAAINVAAVQGGRGQSVVAALARDLLRHGYIEHCAQAGGEGRGVRQSPTVTVAESLGGRGGGPLRPGAGLGRRARARGQAKQRPPAGG